MTTTGNRGLRSQREIKIVARFYNYGPIAPLRKSTSDKGLAQSPLRPLLAWACSFRATNSALHRMAKKPSLLGLPFPGMPPHSHG